MPSKTNLTKAQQKLLEAANRGGVLAFGMSRMTQEALQRRGLLTTERDSLGYYNITPAGRTALSEPSHAE